MSAVSHDPASVLLIDYDRSSLDAVTQILQPAGYQCYCAPDADTARRIGGSQLLDLIICDVRLDQINGMELCQELRRQPGMDDIPVIYISAAQIPDIVRRSHEAGGAYYLRKPVDPEVLLEISGKALWLPHLVNQRLRYEQASERLHPAGLNKHGRLEQRAAVPWRRSTARS